MYPLCIYSTLRYSTLLYLYTLYHVNELLRDHIYDDHSAKYDHEYLTYQLTL